MQEPRAAESSPLPNGAGLAAVDPGGPAAAGDFTLSPGDLNAETTRRVTRPAKVLPTSGVQKLLAGADRRARPGCSDDAFGTAPDPEVKCCLQSDDAASREWIPRGITGVSDAKDNELWGDAANTRLFASYDGWDPGREADPATGGCTGAELTANDACNQKGVRITFVQSRTTPATGSPEVTYRHVLLGWTYANPAGHISFDGLHASEYPLQKSAHTSPAPRIPVHSDARAMRRVVRGAGR